MAFPSSPINGQQVVVNNITYQYDTGRHAWVRVVSAADTFTVNNLVANGNVSAAAFYWANGTPFASSSYGNIDVAAYLTGNITIGNISTGNILSGNVSAGGYYWSNGAPFISSSYSNVNVASYLAGNITVGNLVTNGNIVAIGNIVGGGVRATTSATSPASPTIGDMWYNTTDDTIYRYSDNGVSNFWLDITGPITTTSNIDIVANSPAVLVLQANLGAYQIWANANASAQTTSINSIIVNVTAHTNSIDSINSNVLAVNVAIAGLQSNAAFQANLLDVLTGNASTQGSLLDILVANAAVQSANLTYLLSNAATQEASLTSLVSNAALQSTAIDTLNANIGAYETWANSTISSKAPTSSPTFTGVTTVSGLLNVNDTATFSGTSANSAAKFTNIKEAVYIIASAPSSTQNIDVSSGTVQYFTANASTNWIFNLRFSSGTSIATAMSVGDSITVALLTSQGSTAYYPTSVQIDGSTVGVTTRWQGGVAPTGGNQNSIDAYSLSIIKTAATPTYTILASQAKYT